MLNTINARLVLNKRPKVNTNYELLFREKQLPTGLLSCNTILEYLSDKAHFSINI